MLTLPISAQGGKQAGAAQPSAAGSVAAASPGGPSPTGASPAVGAMAGRADDVPAVSALDPEVLADPASLQDGICIADEQLYGTKLAV